MGLNAKLNPAAAQGNSNGVTHSRVLLNLERVNQWPAPVLDFLEQHYELLDRWEIGAPGRDPRAYDQAIYGLRDILDSYAITGWHCTRLTTQEIANIEATGLQLPNAAVLHDRIDRLILDRQLAPELALQLKCRNQAADDNRAGRVWFCFFPPQAAGERGIERFFRHWGGEALYNSHEDDPITSLALQAIGIPALIEADIPIDALAKHGGLTFKVVRRYLIHKGLHTREPVEHADQVMHPLPAAFIRRVIRFPELDFMTLTGCAQWQTPLAVFQGVAARAFLD